MKRKLIAMGFALILVLSLVTGCANLLDTSSEGSAARNDYPVTVQDIKFASSPEGVVVLSPSLADVVLAMKYEIKLVGRTEQCTQEELSILPVVNGPDSLDVEQIKALPAQLVLTEQSLTEEQVKALSDAGIQTLTLAPATTREEFEKLYTDLGSVLGGAKTGFDKGQRTAKSIFLALDEVERQAEKEKEATGVVITACYLYDIQGKAVTGDSMAGKLIEYSGAVNAVGDAADNTIDLDALKRGNPTYIFCAPGVKAQLAQDDELSSLTAVQEGKVYEIAPELMEWQGYSILDAVEFMAGAMYPNLQGENSSTSSGDTSSAVSGNPFPKGTVIRPGDEGDPVTMLQERLIELRFYYGVDESGVPSGVYDDATERGVQDFQYRMKMEANGIADDETLDAIYAPDAIVRAD